VDIALFPVTGAQGTTIMGRKCYKTLWLAYKIHTIAEFLCVSAVRTIAVGCSTPDN